MRPNRPCLVVAVLAAVLLIALSACGGGGDEVTIKTEPAKVLRAASERTIDAGSSRVAITMRMSSVDGREASSFTGEGVFDHRRRVGSLTFDLAQLGLPVEGEATAETLMLGAVLYMKIPMVDDAFGGRPWLRLDLAEVGRQAGLDVEALQQLRQNDPAAALAYLEGVSDDITVVGEATVRGEHTTHYRVSIDLERAAASVPPELRETMEKMRTQLGVDALPAEVWIDGDGRLRKLAYSVDLARTQTAPAGAGTVSTAVELYDFGVDVAVEEPPSDEVVDFAELLRAGS